MSESEINKNPKISVVGVGYVGLPLAVALSNCFDVQGFDIGTERINELQDGIDSTNELNEQELRKLKDIKFSSDENDLLDTDVFICCVPTPVDSINQPNFKPLQSASEQIGKFLKDGSMVVFESTVYPGATEELCVPILEELSYF